jgi:hypothetical protein
MAALWVQALPPEPDQNKRFRGNPGRGNKSAQSARWQLKNTSIGQIGLWQLKVTSIGQIGPLAV